MRYIVRKFGALLVFIWIAITLNFLIPRLMPGNPAENLIARMKGRADPRVLHALMLQFGITRQPLWQQYGTYLWQLVHGQLGTSIEYYPVPVSTIIGESLPWTLGLIGVATVLAFGIGTLLGIFAAWRRNKLFDSIQGPISMFLGSVPQFWLALLMLWYFGFVKGWFPLDHSYSSTAIPNLSLPFVWDVLRHAFLPGFAFLITSIGGWMLAMRNNMIQVVSDDFVSFARAKGLRDRRIMFTYAARSAILPNVTQFAIALGYAVGGQILIETIFSYPGIGFQMASAVSDQDYPLIQGIFLVFSVVMLVTNFIVEILYARLDPRVRVGVAQA
ncbi:MAG: ABC transporter permease [Firmicutes bacterium]|nr:ABC transporter permease [Bacillota bacterium]